MLHRIAAVRLFIVTAILTCLLFAGHAGETPESENQEQPSEPVTLLTQITVTAEKTPVSVKEATAKVTVITDEAIEKQLVNDIRDLVRYEPGVSVGNDPNRYGLGSFRIRGIGGNRVQTRIDGVSSAESFGLGPIAFDRYFIDVDTLESVEIVRGASSSLYGSDALGGVVDFTTKDPLHYLRGEDQGYALKTGYDGKNDSSILGLTAAFSRGRFEGMIQANGRFYGETDNQGTVDSRNGSRTRPNPTDTDAMQYLAKGVFRASENNLVRLTAEVFDADTHTDLLTAQGTSDVFGVQTTIDDSYADDTQRRLRLSLDQAVSQIQSPVLDTVRWQAYVSRDETEQRTHEYRESAVAGTVTRIDRMGQADYEQESFGFELDLEKRADIGSGRLRVNYGLSYKQNTFSQLRDRQDLDLDTGNPDAYTGTLVFPTRYFPTSDVTVQGAYLQAEASWLDGRVKVIPGVRYDRHELDPDEGDQIYLSGNEATEPPVGQTVDAVSPKLGLYVRLSDNVALTGQVAEGFRAPPYSSVNLGFSNPGGGYQTLPNPDLTPEESLNRELGLKLFNRRGSLQVNVFDNDFEDFIQDTVFVGVSPEGLALFQPRNIDQVQIEGFELAGDYYFGDHWRTRLSYADIDGTDETTGAGLSSIEPRQLVAGLAYRSDRNRFGGELFATITDEKDDLEDPDGTLFTSEGYETIDLTAYWRFNASWRLNAGAFNLTDETYILWTDANGLLRDNPVLDRYTAPGRSFSLNIHYAW